MGHYNEQIKQMLQNIKFYIDSYSNEYSQMPPGNLIHCRNHGRSQLVHAYNNGKYIRRYINKDPELVKALARKEFLGKSIAALKENLRALKVCESKLVSTDPDDIMESLKPSYKKLPRNYFYDPRKLPLDLCSDEDVARRLESHREWAEAPFEQSDYKPEQRRMTTSTGLKVRSKSELLIAESLYRHGVPFRYEQVIPIGTMYFSCDFSFEDAFGCEFYWEHAGMMSDYSYAERHLKKLQQYLHAGIIPGNNLLISYDQDGVINMPVIENMIRYEVIPRL